MLGEACSGPIDERQAALALRLSGEALFATGATDDAARELLAAAKVLMVFDPSLARQTLLAALMAANFAAADVLEEVCSFAAAIVPADLPHDDPPSVVDLFFFGFLRRHAGDAESRWLWTVQQIRNPLMHLGDRATDVRFLVRDRAGQFTASFDSVLASVNSIEAVKVPPQSSRANAYAERFVLTARTEVTDRMLIFGERHLRTIWAEYEGHYNRWRAHRSRRLQPPGPTTLSPTSPRSGSSAGPFSAALSTNTSEPRRSPDQDRWPSSGTLHAEDMY